MIRIIAMLTMILDHMGQVFFPNIIIFPVAGRLALPLFAWGIANGYKKTSNFNAYALRILVLAIVSQYPYMLLFENEYFNVCFTLLTGLIALKVYDLKINIFLKYLMISLLGIVAHEFDFEYGVYGIALVVVFYIVEGKYYLIFMQSVVTLFGVMLYNYYPLQLVSVLSVIIINLFIKHNFKIIRVFQYSFYPVHIVLFLLIKNFIYAQPMSNYVLRRLTYLLYH
ncbi:MAG: conjugal transfer protein TraX [Clostridia bacterium]|nr:conjugal transfer protein TraX [Clostridia bacterium]